jgi:deoxyribose-phosphate aldolase
MQPPATYEDFAQLLTLPLLQPELAASDVFERLEQAKLEGLRCAIVRPCDIDLAVRALDGSGVRVGAAAGFPHGWSGTAVKLYEIRDLLRRGAKEIAMMAPIPKLVSREFPYVQTELLQASEACHKEAAALTVVLESEHLTDEMKIVVCRCAERAEVDAIATTADDVALLRKQLPEETTIELWTETESLDRILELQAVGYSRFVTGAAGKLVEEWKARLASTSAAPGPRSA